MGEHWIHPELKVADKFELAKAGMEILAANLVAKGFTRKELSRIIRYLAERVRKEKPRYDQTS